MISLKRHMEISLQELADSSLSAYRAALAAMAASGARACPPIGPGLEESLLNLQARLAAGTTPAEIAETECLLEDRLTVWGGEAAEYFKKKAGDVKEIMRIMARTVEAVGERDQRYTREFGDFSAKLNRIAEMDDLGVMRQSLAQSVVDLDGCVTRMAQDGLDSVAQLRAELSAYQSKLEEVERMAVLDPLTGLDNRRKVEVQLDVLSRRDRTFTVILLDLDGFKQINDRYGHMVGDAVLKQFASELRGVFRATDVVGRWGGDEFVVVMDCGLKEAQARVERLRQWAFGEYKIDSPSGPLKLMVGASLGLAAWTVGEPVADLLVRADAAMYASKTAGRKNR